MTYDEQIAVIEADQRGKLFRGDDHGVMDCAADLREVKAEKRGYEKGWAAAMRSLQQQSAEGC
jgi:hypothetical protein